MGEIRVKVRFANGQDVLLRAEGKLRRRKVREVEVEAVADTGAVMTLLPQELADKLGLHRFSRKIVVVADNRRILLDQAGPLFLSIGDRDMSTDCLVGPPGCAILVGQLVMEALDLIADPGKRTLTPRPESPDFPVLHMYALAA